ncbi:hypothetical protein KGP17_15365 [Serratia sp. JSRIV001]|uniref:hypothetical protein n=1 Tax=Serratia sp. JSRIV001 TaxID=2831893 RepID=UPI001CBE8FB2|nr:hypothetical protein [Serratia sp. JSRIV001]UAN43864.1 hypothetical protein KGP17_15365 [Serratia sp. JSRIV001]
MKSNKQARQVLEIPHRSSQTRTTIHRAFFSPSQKLIVGWIPKKIKPSRRQRRAEQRHLKSLHENADYSCDYAQEEGK